MNLGDAEDVGDADAPHLAQECSQLHGAAHTTVLTCMDERMGEILEDGDREKVREQLEDRMMRGVAATAGGGG